MRKNLLFPIIVALTALVVIGLFVTLNKIKNTPPPENTIIFFYSDTCPHCKNVEDFFAENKIEEKISFEKLEVGNSTTNAQLLYEKATVCNITKENMGVPLLWDGTTCINGDEPIITYFKNKLGL